MSRDSNSTPSSPPLRSGTSSTPPLKSAAATFNKPLASLSRSSSLHSTKPPSRLSSALVSRANTPSPVLHHTSTSSGASSRSNSINRKRAPAPDSPLSLLLNVPKVPTSANPTPEVSKATAEGSFKQLPFGHDTGLRDKRLLGPMGPISRSSTPVNELDLDPRLTITTNKNALPLSQMNHDRLQDRFFNPSGLSDSHASGDTSVVSANDDSDSGASSGRENEDLLFATSKNLNLVLELSIDGLIRHLSKNWEEIVGTSVSDLINQPVSKIVCGDENDKHVFMRATEVMKTDESSYRVRFVTQKPKGFVSRHSSRNVSTQNLAALNSNNGLTLSFNKSNTDLASIHSSYSDLRLSTLNYPARERSYSVNSASPTSTPHPEGNLSTFSDHASAYPLAEWLPERVKSPMQEDDLDNFLEMEGQGVLIYDHSSGEPSHVSIMDCQIRHFFFLFFTNRYRPCGLLGRTRHQNH